MTCRQTNYNRLNIGSSDIISLRFGFGNKLDRQHMIEEKCAPSHLVRAQVHSVAGAILARPLTLAIALKTTMGAASF